MSEPIWAGYGDEELLKLRFCDLKLSLKDTEVESLVDRLYGELESAGLKHFRPEIYFGDEWFSPEGEPSIAIPFFLAHPRLKALERSIMLEVEGGTPDYCMKLLRHEAGHCFDHAYRIPKTRKWRETFGSPEKDYDPDVYRPRPYSRSYVQNLDNWYAQSHPDEDFAETFAVWVDPESNWRERYESRPIALKKLRFIDELGQKFGPGEPKVSEVTRPYDVNKLRGTLRKFYDAKKKRHASEYPEFYDVDLRKIFNGDPSLPRKQHGAAEYLKRNRKLIVDSVSYWTGERKYTINSLVKKFTARCDQNGLRVGKDEARTNLEVASYLATLVTNYLFTGRFKRSI